MGIFRNRKTAAAPTDSILEETPAAAQAPVTKENLLQGRFDKHRKAGVTQFSDMGASCVWDGTKELDLSDFSLSDADARTVADYIATITEPTNITFMGSSVGHTAAGTTIIAEAIGQNTNIWGVGIEQTHLGDDRFVAFVKGVIANQNLSAFQAELSGEEAYSAAAYEAVSEILMEHSATTTLRYLTPSEKLTPEAQEIFTRNRAIGAAFSRRGDAGQGPSFARRVNYAGGRHGSGMVQSSGTISMNDSNAAYRFQQLVHTEIPRITADDIGSLNDLLEASYASDHGTLRTIDNPHFWNVFPEVAAKLEAAGTPITKDLLLQPNPDGEPILCNAIHAGRLDAVVQHLNARGERITPEDLTPAITAALGRSTQATALMTEDNLYCMRELRALQTALPEGSLLSFEPRNLHSLTASFGRSNELER